MKDTLDLFLTWKSVQGMWEVIETLVQETLEVLSWSLKDIRSLRSASSATDQMSVDSKTNQECILESTDSFLGSRSSWLISIYSLKSGCDLTVKWKTLWPWLPSIRFTWNDASIRKSLETQLTTSVEVIPLSMKDLNSVPLLDPLFSSFLWNNAYFRETGIKVDNKELQRKIPTTC